MARVEAQDLEAEIVRVLKAASSGKGISPGFLTAYQILNGLPVLLQEQLRDEYGLSGKHAGRHFSPASRVAQVAASLTGVEKGYLDTRGLQFAVPDSGDVPAGFDLCAIFRSLPQP